MGDAQHPSADDWLPGGVRTQWPSAHVTHSEIYLMPSSIAKLTPDLHIPSSARAMPAFGYKTDVS